MEQFLPFTGLLLGLVGWLLVRQMKRGRLPSARGPFTFALRYPRGRPVGHQRGLEDLTQALMRRKASDQHSVLDVRQTVIQTARRGGYPTLIDRPRQSPPHYLCLIHRAEKNGSFHEELVHQLEEQRQAGIDYRIYEFEFDPLECHRPDDPQHSIPLRKLIDDDPRGLLVLGDPELRFGGDLVENRARLSELYRLVRQVPARLWLIFDPRQSDTSIAQSYRRRGGFDVRLAQWSALAKLSSPNASPVAKSGGFADFLDQLALEDEYRVRLRTAFPVFCAMALLPHPSPRAARYLLDHLGVDVTGEDRLAFLSLPWIQEGRWPAGLDRDALRILRWEFPELRERAVVVLDKLRAEQVPPEGSGALFEYRAEGVELHVRAGETDKKEVAALASHPRGVAALGEQSFTQGWINELPVWDKHRLRGGSVGWLAVTLACGMALGWEVTNDYAQTLDDIHQEKQDLDAEKQKEKRTRAQTNLKKALEEQSIPGCLDRFGKEFAWNQFYSGSTKVDVTLSWAPDKSPKVSDLKLEAPDERWESFSDCMVQELERADGSLSKLPEFVYQTAVSVDVPAANAPKVELKVECEEPGTPLGVYRFTVAGEQEELNKLAGVTFRFSDEISEEAGENWSVSRELEACEALHGYTLILKNGEKEERPVRDCGAFDSPQCSLEPPPVIPGPSIRRECQEGNIKACSLLCAKYGECAKYPSLCTTICGTMKGRCSHEQEAGCLSQCRTGYPSPLERCRKEFDILMACGRRNIRMDCDGEPIDDDVCEEESYRYEDCEEESRDPSGVEKPEIPEIEKPPAEEAVPEGKEGEKPGSEKFPPEEEGRLEGEPPPK